MSRVSDHLTTAFHEVGTEADISESRESDDISCHMRESLLEHEDECREHEEEKCMRKCTGSDEDRYLSGRDPILTHDECRDE